MTAKQTACVIGASGAIGQALLRQLVADPRYGRVLAFSRSGKAPIANTDSRDVAHRESATVLERVPEIIPGTLDISCEDSIRAAAAVAKSYAPLHRVIIATGILHRPANVHSPAIRPEKSLRQINVSAMAEVIAINTIGPALVIQAFSPLLSRDARSVMSAISARVGSISDNRLGGWVSYRASKAALNMVIKTASIELARTHPHAIIAGLHPGTVDSALSEPFQANVKPEKLFTPDHSAQQLLTVMDNLSPEQSGRCFDFAGLEILP